jgi:hypothetical protein
VLYHHTVSPNVDVALRMCLHSRKQLHKITYFYVDVASMTFLNGNSRLRQRDWHYRNRENKKEVFLTCECKQFAILFFLFIWLLCDEVKCCSITYIFALTAILSYWFQCCFLDVVHSRDVFSQGTAKKV